MADPVTITERQGLALATVMARKGADPAAILARAGARLIPTGPGTWLALGEADDLAARLSGLASVSDQSGGYIVYRIAGPQARALLQKGAFIDLSVPVNAAVTMIAHMGVILWQVDEAPEYDLALFRSYAESFAHWLDANLKVLKDR